MVKRSVARALLASAAAGLIAAMLYAPGATAATKQGCLNRTNTTYKTLLECMTLEGVRAHQAAFQAIANANGGTRAAGTSGYDASVDYVVDTLEAAGWSVDLNFFDFRVAQPVQQHDADRRHACRGRRDGQRSRNGQQRGDADRHQAGFR